MLLVTILVVISLRSSNGLENSGVDTFLDLDGYYELIEKIVSKAQSAADRGEAIENFNDRCNKMMEELFNKNDELYKKIEFMEPHNLERLEGLEKLRKSIDNDLEKQMLVHEVFDSMKIVFEKNAELIEFSKKKERPYKKFTGFLEDCTSTEKRGIEEQLEKIYSLIVPEKVRSANARKLLDALENVFIVKKNELCDENPPQHSFITLFTLIATVEVTGFETIVYSAKLLEKETKNNETDSDIQLNVETVRKRLKDYVDAFRNTMKRVSRMIRTCDPDKSGHVRGETFAEMWGLIQVILMWEYDFVEDDSCSGDCENMYGTRHYKGKCYRNDEEVWTSWNGLSPRNMEKCTTPRKCMGVIHSCKTIWTGNYCKRIRGPRRYDYIRNTYSKSKYYGQWSRCEEAIYDTFQWHRVDFRDCGMCMCVCNDDVAGAESVQIIDFRESKSKYESNRVVVGMRIVESERALQIQVREGEIGPGYSIDNTTLQWIPTHPKVTDETEKIGIDYHRFQANHAFNMNKVVLGDNRVVVGVKFAKSEREEKEEAHIEVQVRSIAYNPATGKLLQGTDRWEKSTMIHDSRLSVASLLPQTAPSRTLIRSESNQYVQMRASDWEEDAGQTTLPLFDTHIVEMKPVSPLCGAGMHYRAADGHGGFIGLNGYSLDYAGLLDHSDDKLSSDPNDGAE